MLINKELTMHTWPIKTNKLFIPAIMPVLIYGGDDLVEVNNHKNQDATTVIHVFAFNHSEFCFGLSWGRGEGGELLSEENILFSPVIVIVKKQKKKKKKNNNNQTTYRSRLIILNYVLGSPGQKNERLQS